MEKRFYLGLILLILLLILGFGSQLLMKRIYEPLEHTLTQACQAALEGDLTAGRALSRKAHQRYDKYRTFSACVSDQTPMDELDRLFGQTAVFGEAQEAVHFASCCQELAVLCRAMTQAHSSQFWGLF